MVLLLELLTFFFDFDAQHVCVPGKGLTLIIGRRMYYDTEMRKLGLKIFTECIISCLSLFRSHTARTCTNYNELPSMVKLLFLTTVKSTKNLPCVL